jgi:hypothetical protein
LHGGGSQEAKHCSFEQSRESSSPARTFRTECSHHLRGRPKAPFICEKWRGYEPAKPYRSTESHKALLVILALATLTETADADARRPTLRDDRPERPVSLDEGFFHSKSFATYAAAFPGMSRSTLNRGAP